MGLGVREIQRGSEIAIEWARSVKRNPLQKGVLRTVTIAKDDITQTIGRDSEHAFLEIIKPGKFIKRIVKSYKNNTTVKTIKYSNGSWSETTFEKGTRPRTNGEFVLYKKNGKKIQIGYGIDGEFNPQEMKDNFMANLKRLGNPKYEVDLRGIFGESPKSKMDKFLSDVKYTVGKFFRRFSKLNREMRNFAKNIDTNA